MKVLTPHLSRKMSDFAHCVLYLVQADPSFCSSISDFDVVFFGNARFFSNPGHHKWWKVQKQERGVHVALPAKAPSPSWSWWVGRALVTAYRRRRHHPLLESCLIWRWLRGGGRYNLPSYHSTRHPFCLLCCKDDSPLMHISKWLF